MERVLSWGRGLRKPAQQGSAPAPPPRRDPSIREPPDDISLLPNISDEAIIGTIRDRFAREQIYTACFQLVIAVNPCTLVPALYTRAVGTRCAMVATPGASEPAPAHVWRVSGEAYADIRKGCERGALHSQTIVITGDSGAGKTESARLIQAHLLSMSALAPELSEAALAQTLLQSTLLLEAFGNAMTTASSPNSSRFGKFSVLVYDEKAQITGSYVETYLLETSRLVWREEGQSNFHVLYMLCAA
ncbi:P-loop containing nucleoside triphosphate hydrolase protein, partial [Pavlovales sp. CCMP2436]